MVIRTPYEYDQMHTELEMVESEIENLRDELGKEVEEYIITLKNTAHAIRDAIFVYDANLTKSDKIV